MKPTKHNGKWYAVLGPDDTIRKGDFCTDQDRYGQMRKSWYEVNNEEAFGAKPARWSGWEFYREVDYLIAQMLEVSEKNK